MINSTKLARNFTKNTTLVIPAHKVPNFNPSPNFKKHIN